MIFHMIAAELAAGGIDIAAKAASDRYIDVFFLQQCLKMPDHRRRGRRQTSFGHIVQGIRFT